jgi:hypothetical protein
MMNRNHYMCSLKMGSFGQCGGLRGSDVWQCALQCARSARSIVCGSVLGSVWHCARQCAAVRQCDSVMQQCESVSHCVRLYAVVWAAVCGSLWKEVCGSAYGSVWQVRSTHICLCRGGGKKPIPRILIRTNRSSICVINMNKSEFIWILMMRSEHRIREYIPIIVQVS